MSLEDLVWYACLGYAALSIIVAQAKLEDRVNALAEQLRAHVEGPRPAALYTTPVTFRTRRTPRTP